MPNTVSGALSFPNPNNLSIKSPVVVGGSLPLKSNKEELIAFHNSVPFPLALIPICYINPSINLSANVPHIDSKSALFCAHEFIRLIILSKALLI